MFLSSFLTIECCSEVLAPGLTFCLMLFYPVLFLLARFSALDHLSPALRGLSHPAARVVTGSAASAQSLNSDWIQFISDVFISSGRCDGRILGLGLAPDFSGKLLHGLPRS